MKNYKISIIVPVYNAKQYLHKCADSLCRQTYSNLEILLIDDGSKDGSGSLCDDFAQEDHRIKAVHKENGGLVSAWKRGVSESTGEYLCFVDSDDWIDFNMIEEMTAHLTGAEREIIAGDYVIERDDGSAEPVWQKLPPGEYKGKDLKEKVIPNLLGREERYVTISRCMKLIARRLIEENQIYADDGVVTGEDTTIMLPCLIDCERLVILDHKAYYHYRYVKDSMIHKYDKNLYSNMQRLKQVTLAIVRAKFTGAELKEREKQTGQEYLFWMLLVLKNEARGNPKGYRKNILTICKSEEIRRLVKETPVEIHQKANRLLYLVMKSPNALTVSILRLAMIWYYRSR